MSDDKSKIAGSAPFASAVASSISADWVMNRTVFPVITDLPDSYTIGIGQIIAHWSCQEWLLQQILFKLLNISNPQGRISVGNARIETSITKIRQLMELKKIESKIDLKALTTDLTASEKDRDLVGHGVWLQDPDTKEIYVQKTSGTWEPGEYKGISKRIIPQGLPMNKTSLEKIRDNIKATIVITHQLEQEIDAALKASP